MFPISGSGDDDAMLNDHGMFTGNLSEEEIDVINADEDDLDPGSDEEQSFNHPEHVYMVNDEGGEVFEEDEMPYEPYMEEGQFERVPVQHYDEGILENQELYNAHYMNVCDEYLIERPDDSIYNTLENPAYIQRLPEETRLELYPEQKMLPPLRRPARRPYDEAPGDEHLAPVLCPEEKKLKKYQPAAAALLKTIKFYSSNFIGDKEENFIKTVKSELLVEDPSILDSSEVLIDNSEEAVELLEEVTESSVDQSLKMEELEASHVPIAEKEVPTIQKVSNVGRMLAKPKATEDQKNRERIQMRKFYKPPPPPVERVTPKPKESNGLPLTPLPDRYFQRRTTISAEQAGFVSDCVQCHICSFLFRNTSLLESHLKKHQQLGRKEVFSNRAGLICAYSTCVLRCDSIATVIKHMRMAHNINDFSFERIVFKSYSEFKMWKAELERLTMSRFSRTSGKRNIFSKSIYYQCHHSGITPNNHKLADMRKARCRQSKKLGKTCTAFFHIRENDDGTVLLRGCTKHSGHGVDVRQLPLSQEIRMEIAHLLIKGYDENSIVETMRVGSANTNRRFFLQNYEVRNVANKIDRFKEEYKRKLSTGEPLPDLAEVIRDGRRGREMNPIARTILSCNQYPADGEQMEDDNEYDESPGYETYYEEGDNSNYDEVVVEEGVFNVPASSTVEAFTEVAPEDGDVVLEKLLVHPDSIKGRRKVDHRKIIPIANDIDGSEIPLRRSVQKRSASQMYEDEEEEVEDYDQLEHIAHDSTPQPSRQSLRLQKKRRTMAEDDPVEGEHLNVCLDSQLVGDDEDYVPGAE